MKQKALVIGALPSPFEGPWVDVSDAERWVITPKASHKDKLRLDVEGGPALSFIFDGKPVVFSGLKARVVILEEFESSSVTVVAEEVVSGES